MTDPKKQQDINAMARSIELTEQVARDAHCGLPSPNMYAEDLYRRGVRPQPDWIDATMAVPGNPDDRVLVFLDLSKFIGSIGIRTVDTDRFKDGKWVRWGDRVRYWMPIPVPPSGDPKL